MRNPAGNFYQKADEVWKGDWGPTSEKWTLKTRRQCNYFLTKKEIREAQKRGKEELKAFRDKDQVKRKQELKEARNADETGKETDIPKEGTKEVEGTNEDPNDPDNT